MDDVIQDLMRLGFSENEARVYMALLRLGPAKASQIAGAAKRSRGTTYDVLRSLQEQNLLHVKSERSERIYVAEPPSRLSTILEERRQRVESQQLLADTVRARLGVFYTPSNKRPRIRYIETIEGLRLMHREYEAMDDDIIQLLGYDSYKKLHRPDISERHIQAIQKKQRKIRSIVVTDETLQFDDEHIEFVCLPNSLAPVEGEMTVCGDRVTLFSYASGLIAVEIRSQAIADTARLSLELAWNEAQRLAGM